MTPWFSSAKVFEPKSSKDRRSDSEFFAEFSTESLFSDRPTGNGLLDPYEVLGLFPGASLAQVKKAHRTMAKKYHPDRFVDAPEAERVGAEERMVQVNAAYAELLARIDAADR